MLSQSSMEFTICATHAERAPGEQGGDRIELGRIDVSTQFSRFELNGTHATERIADP